MRVSKTRPGGVLAAELEIGPEKYVARGTIER